MSEEQIKGNAPANHQGTNMKNMSNRKKKTIWAKLRDAKIEIRDLEMKVEELEERNKALRAERHNLLLDCESYQKKIDKANERYNKILSMLEDTTARKAEAKTTHDYLTLDSYFKENISLEESKESVAEAASVLAMIPHTSSVDERAAYAHTIAQCLYDYQNLLRRI